jgi:hypothetical protein
VGGSGWPAFCLSLALAEIARLDHDEQLICSNLAIISAELHFGLVRQCRRASDERSPGRSSTTANRCDLKSANEPSSAGRDWRRRGPMARRLAAARRRVLVPLPPTRLAARRQVNLQ